MTDDWLLVLLVWGVLRGGAIDGGKDKKLNARAPKLFLRANLMILGWK